METKRTPLETLKEEVRNDVLNTTKSTKLEFTYYDAVKYQSKGTERSRLLMNYPEAELSGYRITRKTN